MKERNANSCEVSPPLTAVSLLESYELNNTPPLGGLVIAENVIGVVCSARTEGLGPISAKGSLGDEDGGVYQLYPDLQRTLRTNFTALVVGCYADDDGRNAVYTYPECPPRVHYKCWLAGDDELVRFTDRPDYLRLLLFSTEADPASMDQVLIHLILRSFRAQGQRPGLALLHSRVPGQAAKRPVRPPPRHPQDPRRPDVHTCRTRKSAPAQRRRQHKDVTRCKPQPQTSCSHHPNRG